MVKSLCFRTKNYLTILVIASWVYLPISKAVACCSTPTQTLIELLNTKDTSLHIFTGKVLKTIKVDEFASLVEVTQKLKGHPKDTILLHTGGFSSAGGKYLEPGSQHFIVSRNRDGFSYYAYVCDIYSAPLSINKLALFVDHQDFIGMYRLKNVLKYYQYQYQKYTGKVKFIMDDKIVAEGAFDEGQPTGEWRYFQSNQDGEMQPFSIANYDRGQRSGRYVRYGWRSDYKSYEAFYVDNQVVSAKMWRRKSQQISSSLKYTYDKEQTTIEDIQYDATGRVVGQSTWVRHTLAHNLKLRYQHGYAFQVDKKTGLTSRGEYYYGAKVGDWKQYNDAGDLIDSTVYPYPNKYEENDLTAYRESGVIKQSIRYNHQGHKIFVVQYDKKGTPYMVKTVSQDGWVTQRNFSKHGRSETYYRNNKREGLQTSYRADSTLSYSTRYKCGLKHGPQKEYYKNGNLKSEKNYVNNLLVGEEHFYKNNGELLCTNFRDQYGCLQGAYALYVDGVLRSEGKYLDGYKVGEWKEYRSYNTDKYSYIVHKYRDLPEHSSASRVEQLIVTEYYNDKGEKISR